MKHQILNKILDISGQLMCILFPILIFLQTANDAILSFIYFALGLWQLLSFMLNMSAADKSVQATGARKVYGGALRVILVAGVISLIALMTPIGVIAFGYMFAMLIVGALMAVFYIIISVVELRKLISANTKLNK